MQNCIIMDIYFKVNYKEKQENEKYKIQDKN